MSDELTKAIESIPPAQLDVMRKRFQDEIELSGAVHVAAATKFQAGLDKVVDVLLILVLKFARATSALIAIGFVLIVCLVTLIIATVKVLEVSNQVAEIQQHQDEFSMSQKRIEESTTATQKQVDSTSQKIDATQAVLESDPHVEVDTKTGRAKIIIPAKAKKPATATAPAVASSKPLEIDLK
jgi:hypothetical protein